MNLGVLWKSCKVSSFFNILASWFSADDNQNKAGEYYAKTPPTEVGV